MMISFCAGSRSDAFRVNGFRGSIRPSGRNGSAVPDVGRVTASGCSALNRVRVPDVRRGMRDFATATSRGLTCAAVLLSAVVHLDLWDQGFRDIHRIGPLFVLNAVAGLVIGAAVLMWRSWLPAVAAVGFGAATVIAFWISVVHGLFGVNEVATGTSEVLAEFAEYAAVALV
jgi:hypothetical protein